MELIKKIASRVAAPAYLALHGLSVFAAVTTGGTAPDVTPNTSVTDVSGFKDKIASVADTAIGAIGIIAVIMLVYGGYLYVTAGTNEDNTKKAKSIILYAFIGLAIAILSYVIVNVSVSFIGS